MDNRLQLSEGVFIYVLGLVVIASHLGRFWFGFTLAGVPIVMGLIGRLFTGVRWHQT